MIKKYLNFFQTEKLRKNVALSLAVAVGLITLYISVLYGQISDFDTRVNRVITYAESQENIFIDQSIRMNMRYLNYVNYLWLDYNEAYPYRVNREQAFSDTMLPGISDLTRSSMIVVHKDEDIIFMDYQHEPYNLKEHLFYSGEIEKTASLQILQNGNDTLYVVGRWLYCEGERRALVQIAFSNAVIYMYQVPTLDKALFDEAVSKAKNIQFYSAIFMIGLIVYGVFLMSVIRHFVLDALRTYVKQDLIGQMAVNRGFMTKEQLEICLLEQEKQVKE